MARDTDTVCTHARSSSGSEPPKSRRRGGNGLLLRALNVVVGSLLTVTSALAADARPELAARSAAESWLALVDAGKVAESYEALAVPAKQAIGAWRWKLGFNLSQRKFGGFRSRKLRAARFAFKSPSGRAGEYVFLEFDSISARQGAVVEKLATIHEPDGRWRVVTYTVE